MLTLCYTKGMKRSGYMPTAQTVEWSTPQDLYDKLNEEFRFTVDVAASDDNHKTAFYYTEDENGLVQDWSEESVWCNPPYGRGIKDWVEKAAAEQSSGTVVMLIPARTDTAWFHDYIYGRAEIRFIRGRLKFGGHKNAAPFPNMIVIWRNL